MYVCKYESIYVCMYVCMYAMDARIATLPHYVQAELPWAEPPPSRWQGQYSGYIPPKSN